MTTLPPVFSPRESAVLIAMYEVENGRYSSYTLAQKLYPDAKRGTEAEGAAFEQTRDTTEELIVKGLVSGERQSSPNGVYFEKLRLTAKGEQTAIQVRNSAKELEKSLPDFVKRSNEVVEEIRKSSENK
jgi:hypothetical protein